MDFCRLTPAQRKELTLFGTDTQKAQDVERAIEQMPLCTSTFTAFVEGKDPKEDIMSTDMVTLKIKTVFENMGPHQQPGYVHSQRFPFLKRGKVFFMVVDAQTKERLVMLDIQVPKENFVEHEMKQRFQRGAVYKFVVKIFHDSYIGFDHEAELELTIKEETGPTKVIDYDDEDLAAVKGPGMVQSMLDIKEDDSESEEEGKTESDRLASKLKKAGLENATEVRNEKEREEMQRKLVEASQLLHNEQE